MCWKLNCILLTDTNVNSVGDNSEYQLIKPGETEERIEAVQSVAGGGFHATQRQVKKAAGGVSVSL